jgi:cellulose synthase/poly-beta-1,6-N-acetylglucosamine synthase-like glycosyltransferase
VVIDTSRPKNKPKALNAALPACRGDVVGVFDAEDEVHPQLLRHVDARSPRLAPTSSRAACS